MNKPAFHPFHFVIDDGLKLYGRDYSFGASKPTPIVCLAGLSRNSRDFHQLAVRLNNEGYRVVTLDYRGRGESDWDKEPANYNVVREGQDVIAALDHLGIRKAIFIGTSRGGLILHILASTHLERIVAVVLNDIGPVIEVDGLRRIRDYLSNRREYPSLAEVSAALKTIHGDEFPALSHQDWVDMAEALYRDKGGEWIADFDPALTVPLKTMDMSQPLPDLWQQFMHFGPIPILVIRGENSALLSKDTVQEMMSRHGDTTAVTIDGQGHAPLLHVDAAYRPLVAFLKSSP